MNSKRGQLSVFIIITLVVLILIIIYFFAVKENPQQKIIKSQFESYIQECIEETANSGLEFVLFHGGYYNPPKDSADYLFTKIPYYFYLGNKIIPSRETIENEFSGFIKDELNSCIKNFSGLNNQDFEIKSDIPNVYTYFGKELALKINYPISIIKDKNTVTLKKFEYNRKFNFEKLYNILSKLSEEQQKNLNFVPIGYLSVLAKEQNFKFNINYLSKNDIVYTLIFSDLSDRNETFFYNFAAKYDWAEPRLIEKKVEIEAIPYQRMFAGREFNYQVKAKGDNVKFDDYTDLFDIDKDTGKIKFIPKSEQSRTYEILLRAYDKQGNDDNALMILEIEKVIENLFQINKTIGSNSK